MPISMFNNFSFNKSSLSVIFLHLLITINLSYFLNIWADESFTLQTTSKSIGYAYKQALFFESQAPFYFCLLSIWRSLSNSIFWARIFSVLCITITLILIPFLSRNFFEKINPTVILIIVAFNPFVIWAATEIRCYALVILLSALLLLLFYKVFFCDEISIFSIGAYTVVSIIALYTQYYLGFLLFSNAVVLLLFKKWKPLVNYFLSMAIVLIAFLPIVFELMNQVNTLIDYDIGILSPLEKLKVIITRYEDYLWSRNDLPPESRWILRFIVLFLGLFTIIKKNKYLKVSNNDGLWILAVDVLVVSLFFLIVIRLLGVHTVTPRHTSLLFIPVVLLYFGTIASAWEARFTKFGVFLLLLLYLPVLSYNYFDMAKSGDWKRVSSFLMENENKNEPIIVFRNELALPLQSYYSGKNLIMPFPRPMEFDNYRYNNFALKNIEEVKKIFSEKLRNHEYLWYVTDDLYKFSGVNFNKEYLEKFLRNNYSLEKEVIFSGGTKKFFKVKGLTKVQLFHKKSNHNPEQN